jgi:hypothetical protein
LSVVWSGTPSTDLLPDQQAVAAAANACERNGSAPPAGRPRRAADAIAARGDADPDELLDDLVDGLLAELGDRTLVLVDAPPRLFDPPAPAPLSAALHDWDDVEDLEDEVA